MDTLLYDEEELSQFTSIQPSCARFWVETTINALKAIVGNRGEITAQRGILNLVEDYPHDRVYKQRVPNYMISLQLVEH